MILSRGGRQLARIVGSVAIVAAAAGNAGCSSTGASGSASTTAAASAMSVAASAASPTTRSGSETAVPASGGAATVPATASASAAPSTPGQPQQSTTAAGSAVVLPFTGLSSPTGVAVSENGYVYVTDTGNNRVVELPTSGAQVVLGFSSLNAPSGVGLDNNANVFVTDATTSRELWSTPPSQTPPSPPWQAVTTTEFVGPFSGLAAPRGVINGWQFYYVVDSGNNRVLKWHGGNAPDVVPFTGLNGPDGIALTESTSDVWVVDTGNNRVLRLQTFGQPTPVQTVLPLTGLSSPHGVVRDTAIHNGSDAIILYITDTGNNRVLKLSIDDATHTASQSMLPFAGLNKPTGIAEDGQGDLYVVDSGNNRVVKLDKAFTG